MKYLKLDARFEECHGLARALAGSICGAIADINIDSTLLSMHRNEFLFVTSGGIPCCLTELFLPLDTLKLCPFIAMRERIKVKAKREYPNEREWTESIEVKRNTIDSIRFDCTRYDFAIVNDYEIGFWLEKCIISIDFDNLPKGAEIVEIE